MNTHRCENCVDIAGCPVGTTGVVTCVLRTAVNTPAVRRLAELGLRRGAHVTTVQKTPGGGRVLAIGDGRLAVDKHTLSALHISPSHAP